MKKATKSIILFALIAMMLVVLTGCGNKLTATKTSSDIGTEVKETIVVKFKNDKVNEAIVTYEFSDEEESTTYYKLFSAFLSDNVEQSGKKVILTMTAEEFLEDGEESSGMSKSEIKKQLEDEGYKVK